MPSCTDTGNKLVSRRLQIPLAFVIALLVGCGNETQAGVAESADDVPLQPHSSIPTHSGDGLTSDAAEIVGDLAGQVEGGVGCLWLEGPDGRRAILWPAGYSATFSPVQLIGPDGSVIAQEGQQLRASGGYGPAPDMTQCRLGQEEIARIDRIIDVR